MSADRNSPIMEGNAKPPGQPRLSMPHVTPASQNPVLRGRDAFSLVELLVVVAIVGIIAALTVPGLSSMMQASDLARGGQLVTDQVNLARQIASAKNTVVEMRFIELPERAGFGALQLWNADSTGGMKAANRMITLPQSVTIAPNPPLPGAMASLPSTNTMQAGNATTRYAALQIRPSGQVTPTMSMSNLFFAVVPTAFANEPRLPTNYFLLQINPLTGVPLVYRP